MFLWLCVHLCLVCVWEIRITRTNFNVFPSSEYQFSRFSTSHTYHNTTNRKLVHVINTMIIIISSLSYTYTYFKQFVCIWMKHSTWGTRKISVWWLFMAVTWLSSNAISSTCVKHCMYSTVSVNTVFLHFCCVHGACSCEEKVLRVRVKLWG